jgi:hypothetical protein
MSRPSHSFYILSPEQYWVRRTDHWTPHYVVFFHPLVTSLLSGPNILPSTLFSNTLSLRSSLHVRDQVSDFLASYEVKNIISTRFLLATVTMVRQCKMCVSKKRLARERTLLIERCVCVYCRSHKDVISSENVISYGFDSRQFQSHETLTYVVCPSAGFSWRLRTAQSLGLCFTNWV